MLHRHRPRSIGRAAAALALSALAFSRALPAQARETAGPANATAQLKSLVPESARTRVLVLATFHLRQIAETFKPAMLDGIVSRLEAFKPDAICIETLPGSRIQEYEARREAGPLYPEVLDGFGATHLKLGKMALARLGTTPGAAFAKVRELLAAVRAKSGNTTPDERASLALWMAAAYEPASAALQWSYLTAAAKKAQTAVPADLAAELDAQSAKVNEGPALAARLARALGLQTLEAVDDFEDLDAYSVIMPQLEKDFADAPLLKAAPKAPIYAKSDALLADSLRRGDLRPQYVFMNSPEYAAADVDAQWGVFLRTHFASGTDRARLALWENRNLKIAARVRAVTALHPGGRVLVIYGAAHKPFLDADLGEMSDLEIVGAAEAGIR